MVKHSLQKREAIGQAVASRLFLAKEQKVEPSSNNKLKGPLTPQGVTHKLIRNVVGDQWKAFL